MPTLTEDSVDQEKGIIGSGINTLTQEVPDDNEHQSGDIGLKILQDGVPEWTVEQENRVRWKIDLNFLPLLCVAFLLQFLDKTAVSYAAVWGLKKETGLVGNQYSDLQTFFYVGYIICEFPVTWAMQKFNLARAAGVMIFIWGGVLIGMIGANDYKGLVACRVFLGAAEAGITPAFVHMTGMYYLKKEQPLRLCIWFMMNGVCSIVGGPIAYAIGNIKHTSLATYKYPFLIYGIATVVFGAIFFFVCPANPLEARWLTDEEKKIAVARLASNQNGVDNKTIKRYQVIEALLDPTSWMLGFFCMAACIANSGLTAFGPLIIAGFGYSNFQATLLNMPAGATQVVGMLFIGILTSKKENMRCLLMITGSIVALIGACMVYAIPTENKLARLLGYYLIPVYITSFVLSLNHIQANVAGRTKKSVVALMWFVFNSIGNLIGPQFYMAKQSPRYQSGFASMVACVSAMCLIPALLAFYLHRQNMIKAKKRIETRADEEPADKIALMGMMDLTDKENPYFVYSL